MKPCKVCGNVETIFVCKECVYRYRKQIYYLKNKISVKKYQYKNNKKISKRKQQHYQENKEIYSIKNKIQYEKNKEKILANSKINYQKNKEKILQDLKKDRINNKEKFTKREKKSKIKNKNKINIRQNNRYKNDIQFKLRSIISSTIRDALKGNKNNLSILKYLPETIETIKQSLEAKFEPWMTWENHGNYNPNWCTWQIDHIIPQSALPYTSMEDENFKICWSADNLQPLEAIDNIRKGAMLNWNKK